MIALNFRMGLVLNNGPEGDDLDYFIFTRKHYDSVCWLLSNVGPYKLKPTVLDNNIRPDNDDEVLAALLPIEGIGWRIAEGFNLDDPVDKITETSTEKPHGRFGQWLCIDDQNMAMQLIRNGLLDAH